MRTTNKKSLEYLKGNPIVADFINKVNIQRKDYYVKADMPSQYQELIVEVGQNVYPFMAGNILLGFH